RLRQANYARRLQEDLVRAGVDLQASRFLIIQGIAATTTFLAVWYFAGTVPDLKGFLSLVVAIPAFVIAWYVPNLTLKLMESNRLSRLERQLPPTIDAMAGALQAGSSLPQAMEM